MIYQTHDVLITLYKCVRTPQDKISIQQPPILPTLFQESLSWFCLYNRSPTPILKVVKLSFVWYHMVESRSANRPLPVHQRAAVVDGDPLDPVIQPCLRQILPNFSQLIPSENVLLVSAMQSPLVCQRRLPSQLHDGSQVWQLVLNQEDLLEQRLSLHHRHINFGVDASSGNVVCWWVHRQAKRDATGINHYYQTFVRFNRLLALQCSIRYESLNVH